MTDLDSCDSLSNSYDWYGAVFDKKEEKEWKKRAAQIKTRNQKKSVAAHIGDILRDCYIMLFNNQEIDTTEATRVVQLVKPLLSRAVWEYLCWSKYAYYGAQVVLHRFVSNEDYETLSKDFVDKPVFKMDVDE